MNHGLIKDDRTNPAVSRRDLFIVLVGGLISASLGLVLVSPASSSFVLAPLLSAINMVSMTFATGLFSFLTAGLLFSSRASRLYLQRRIDDAGARNALLHRVLHVLLVTSLFTFLFTIIVFLYPVVPHVLAFYPISFDHFVYYPAVLGASLVGSALLALIASSLAIFTDDPRICIVLGCVSTLLIAFLGGWNAEPNPWHYSLTRNLAFLSPHNMVRALAIVLSGYQFESANRMVEYVGFAFSAESPVIALLSLSAISIALLIVGQRVLGKNSARWTVLGSVPAGQEIWPVAASPERSLEIKRIRRGLRIQRGLVTLVVGSLLLSMAAGVSLYTTYLSQSTIFIHYYSPGDTERVPVGTWNIYDVDVQPPFPGLFNSLFMNCHVETWGNASDSLSFYFGIVAMNSTNFNSLDEESRLALLPSHRLNHTWDGGWGFGLGENLEESYGPYICVLLIIADANPLENSYIEAGLLIVQQGI